MLPLKLAFVDIETTGSSLLGDRIIEVGVLRVEDNKLVQTFKSLVNPETYLPEEISYLTGISPRELENAPVFSGIKKDLLEILEDCVFVAHNVRFDYGFIKNEFRKEGLGFKAKNLCTVKLSRQLFPRFKHHSLDHIIERFGFSVEARHRAFDDAEILWKFYQLLQKQIPEEKLEQIINKVLKRPSVPINISEKILDDLPENPGVYIFYGKEGCPLYVGKSVNVRERVMSHFAGDHSASTEMKIAQQVENIETVETAGELGALFREALTIKKLQPLYNRRLRNARKMVILKGRMNEKGYLTATLEDVSEVNLEDLAEILGIFRSKKAAKDYLWKVCEEQRLCEKLLGLENGKGACFGHRLGKCRGACLGEEKAALYNGRVMIGLAKNKIRPWPFAGPILITEKGLESDRHEAYLIDRWCYLGSVSENNRTLEKDIHFDLDTYKILCSYLRKESNLKNIKVLKSTANFLQL